MDVEVKIDLPVVFLDAETFRISLMLMPKVTCTWGTPVDAERVVYDSQV
jgi:hypothetical protein